KANRRACGDLRVEGLRCRSGQGRGRPDQEPRRVSPLLPPGTGGSGLRARCRRPRRLSHGALGRALVVLRALRRSLQKLVPGEGQPVKIEAITLREIRMPLVHFFETSFGRTTQRRILLVTLHTDGPEGWGECVAGEDPFYSEESVDTAWYATEKYLAPVLLGKTIAKGADVPALLERVRGHRMAKGALENAVWDAEAQERQQPLWRLLGGTQAE